MTRKHDCLWNFSKRNNNKPCRWKIINLPTHCNTHGGFSFQIKGWTTWGAENLEVSCYGYEERRAAHQVISAIRYRMYMEQRRYYTQSSRKTVQMPREREAAGSLCGYHIRYFPADFSIMAACGMTMGLNMLFMTLGLYAETMAAIWSSLRLWCIVANLPSPLLGYTVVKFGLKPMVGLVIGGIMC